MLDSAIEDLLDTAHDHARAYLRTLPARRVYPSPNALEALDGFSEPFPERPSDAADTIEMLQEIGSPATVAQTGGRYFGFVDGGMLPVGLAARWLADTWDQNTAHYVMSPVAAKLEEVCEDWLRSLFGLPEETAAGFVTGTTLANLAGLAAARNKLLAREGWDVASHGLYGAPPIRVLVGAGAHAAVYKTLGLLGMGGAYTEIIPTDAEGRMLIDAIPSLNGPVLAITQAGNVNSGAFDPVGRICEIVHDDGGWVHVDGAFGLWAAASPHYSELYRGVEKADSWAVDAHKTLNAPYDCGVVLCKDRQALLAAFRASADYFQWSPRRDPMNYTPSMSKRARSIELWAILKTLGRSGVGSLVEQLCDHARMLASKLLAAGFKVHNEVVFNQVMVSCGDDRLTSATLEEIQAAGEIWCGGSRWNEDTVIRLSVCSWATSEGDIERAVAALIESRRRATATR